MQLCGFINAEEWEKVCRMYEGFLYFNGSNVMIFFQRFSRFHLNEREGTITFEEFLSYFPENEVRQNFQIKIRLSPSVFLFFHRFRKSNEN